MKHLMFLAVVMLACLAAHGQTGPQGKTNTDGERPDPALRRDLEIKKLVAGSDVIVLGSVARVYDGTARDGGMSYDVKIDSVLYGKAPPENTLTFRSAGWMGYGKYVKDEKVLLFLRRWRRELLQLQPVSYLAERKQPPNAIFLSPLKDCLAVIKAEIQKKRAPDRP